MAGMDGPHASVSLALAGSGGAGVMTAGNLLLEAAAKAGYYALMTRTSGPQIRGGEAAAMLRVSTFAGYLACGRPAVRWSAVLTMIQSAMFSSVIIPTSRRSSLTTGSVE